MWGDASRVSCSEDGADGFVGVTPSNAVLATAVDGAVSHDVGGGGDQLCGGGVVDASVVVRDGVGDVFEGIDSGGVLGVRAK